MSMSSCSLSMKICCMQPWKRFSLVSHFLIVLLVCGQPEQRENMKQTKAHRLICSRCVTSSPHLQKSSGPPYERWKGWWSLAENPPPHQLWGSAGCLWLPDPLNASNHHLACILEIGEMLVTLMDIDPELTDVFTRPSRWACQVLDFLYTSPQCSLYH